MATSKATANPTKADIIRILIVQAHADAERRLSDYEAAHSAEPLAAVNKARLRGEVATLARLKDKVVAYLDRGDLSVLIR